MFIQGQVNCNVSAEQYSVFSLDLSHINKKNKIFGGTQSMTERLYRIALNHANSEICARNYHPKAINTFSYKVEKKICNSL